jgi:hypothetical protein
VTLRLDLPKHALKPLPIDFDVAEAFQAFVRVAMTHAVDHLGARSLELCVASSGRSLHVELRVLAKSDRGATEPGGSGTERPGTDAQDLRLEKLRAQIEAVGGTFELQADAEGEVTLRASAPLRPLRK